MDMASYPDLLTPEFVACMEYVNILVLQGTNPGERSKFCQNRLHEEINPAGKFKIGKLTL